MKTLLYKLPEYTLILLALLAGYQPPFSMNPIFGIIIFLLILQIIFKNRVSGLLLGGCSVLGSFLFLGALLSEFHEFPEFSLAARELILVGLGIWILCMSLSLLMIYKYMKPVGSLRPLNTPNMG